jgi:L-seryl-tRNA(Ser) seleniumtransferase
MIAATPARSRRASQAVIRALGATAAVGRSRTGARRSGGGSLPGETLPTRLLAAPVALGRRPARHRLATGHAGHRRRIERDRLVFDLRTILPDEDELFAATLAGCLAPCAS